MNDTQQKASLKHALNLRSHAFLLQTTLKKLSELASLIDIRNPFFTREIMKLNNKLLELKTCNFWLKIRNF